jgi:two-component system cell cycle sensor histidine kinase/response regulator CckA
MLLRRLLGERVELDVNHARDLWVVKADVNQFEQVIVNLVVNARDAMPGGGRVGIRTRNVTASEAARLAVPGMGPADYVAIEVADTGTGMSPEVKEKIFEPFFTTKEVGKGTGLGLSSVYGIVQQSGGSISVFSEPGRGTTFKIFFPLVEDVDPATGEARVRAKPAKPASGEVILLAEDEDTVRKFLGTTLRANGYQVLEAGDGAQALEVGRRASKVDLLLTDIVMPRMNGGKLAESLRAHHPNLRVLFMSGYTKDALNSQDLEKGAAQFLQKPFRQSDVIARVKEMLRPRPRES